MAVDQQLVLAKIRKRLFGRFEPRDLFVNEATEQVLPPVPCYGWTSLGGLSYFLNLPDRILKLSIEHSKDDTFKIYIEDCTGGQHFTARATLAPFRNLDIVVLNLIRSFN